MREHAAAAFHQLARRAFIRRLRKLRPCKHRLHRDLRLIHDLPRGDARPDPLDDRVAILQYELQQLPLHRAVLAINRPHARHIARVIAIVRREIHQHQLPAIEFRHVAVIVRIPDVCRTRRRDRPVPFQPRAIHQKHIASRGIEFVLVHPRPRTLHRFQNPLACNLRRTPDQRNFPRTLHTSQFIEHRRQVRDASPRKPRGQHPRELHLARNAAVPKVVEDRRIRRVQLKARLRGAFTGREQRVNRQRRLLPRIRQTQPV